MPDEPTWIHGPADDAPEVTESYARCAVCGCQWQVRSFASPPTDAQSCQFCGAGASAISVISEAPTYRDLSSGRER